MSKASARPKESESEMSSEWSESDDSDVSGSSTSASDSSHQRLPPAKSGLSRRKNRRGESKCAPSVERPSVKSMPLDGSDDAKRLNVSPDVLQRMLSIAKVAMNPGTEAEGRNAETVLSKYLVKHAVDRACFEQLMKPSTQTDLLREAARFRVRNFKLKRQPAWVAWLGGAVSVLFETGHYLQRPSDVVFYGEADMANSAAELFADLFVSVSELGAAYAKRTPGLSLAVSRESYRRGLMAGFRTRCEGVVAQRKAYVRRVREDAEARERAAQERAERRAELAEKARLQRERARAEVVAAEAEVVGVQAERVPLRSDFRVKLGADGDSDDEPLFARRPARPPAPAAGTSGRGCADSGGAEGPKEGDGMREEEEEDDDDEDDDDDDDDDDDEEDDDEESASEAEAGPSSDVECLAEETVRTTKEEERQHPHFYARALSRA